MHRADELQIHDQVREMDLNLIALLDCLLRYHSVGTTADQLGITQSAASRSLARLRHLFDDPLFVKTNNRMLPTTKALSLAPTVHQIMSLIRDSFLPALKFDAATATRTIAIAITDIGEIALLPKVYRLVQDEAPNCGVHTVNVEGAEKNALENGSVSMVIHSEPPQCGELMQQVLFREEFTVIAHKDSDLPTFISQAQFAASTHIVYRSAHSSQVLDGFFKEHSIQRKIAIHTPNMHSIPEMVCGNPGLIATIPSYLAHVYQSRGLVRILQSSFILPHLDVFQYWHRRYDKDPFNVWLRNIVHQTAMDYLRPALTNFAKSRSIDAEKPGRGAGAAPI